MLQNLELIRAARRVSILGLCFLVMGVHGAFAQSGKANAPAVSFTEAEQEVISLWPSSAGMRSPIPSW
jgi:hypothetical protein